MSAAVSAEQQDPQAPAVAAEEADLHPEGVGLEDSDDDSSDSNVEDWDEVDAQPATCPICEAGFEGVLPVWQHVQAAHGWDFVGFCRERGLDFYSRICLINWLRAQVAPAYAAAQEGGGEQVWAGFLRRLMDADEADAVAAEDQDKVKDENKDKDENEDEENNQAEHGQFWRQEKYITPAAGAGQQPDPLLFFDLGLDSDSDSDEDEDGEDREQAQNRKQAKKNAEDADDDEIPEALLALAEQQQP